jgi:hypothetical protein
MIATQEFVVPRSIPITFAMFFTPAAGFEGPKAPVNSPN